MGLRGLFQNEIYLYFTFIIIAQQTLENPMCRWEDDIDLEFHEIRLRASNGMLWLRIRTNG